jgi:hypothetical protein
LTHQILSTKTKAEESRKSNQRVGSKHKNKMEKIFNRVLIGFITMSMIACNTDGVKFEPGDKRPIQSIQVADSDEAALLQQELALEVKMVEGNTLFYFVNGKEQEQKLLAIGYSIKKENPMQVNYRVVQLSLKGMAPDASKAEEILKHGIKIINKEKDYWVVRGSLEALTKIQELNYKVKIETKEPRPRQVEITVPLTTDIQKVNELGVDIYSTIKSDKERFIIITGGAFDYQIEQMQAIGYKVILK